MTTRSVSRASTWTLMLAAAAVLAITMGSRQTLGLFISPLNTATGLGIVTISFAMAVGQFVWGVSQPIFGAVADRYGSGRVIVAGGILLALGWVLASLASNEWMLIMSIGIVLNAGAGAGSFSILLGATAGSLPPERRAFAGGFINAGASFGQFFFAPLVQMLIQSFGWITAMMTLALSALATLPIARVLRRPRSESVTRVIKEAATNPIGMRAQLQIALKDRSYWCLHAGFFTCGFHIAFLVTHLPGEVGLCGLPAGVAATSLAIIGLANIVGSLGVGVLGSRYRMKSLLFWLYLSRAAIIAIYLAAPKTAFTFYVFAAALGITWLSTVPPTAGLVGKLFGMRYLATLFGLTLLSHQIGGFFGAWLGGIAVVTYGSYQWMWYADIALAIAAAVVNLPIEEVRPARVRPATA